MQPTVPTSHALPVSQVKGVPSCTAVLCPGEGALYMGEAWVQGPWGIFHPVPRCRSPDD